MRIVDSKLKFKNGFTRRGKTDMVVLHHSEAAKCTVNDIHGWHLNKGWNGFGYHLFIRKDGTVFGGRPLWAEGAQCSGHNGHTIGVCFEGNCMHSPPTSEQVISFRDVMGEVRKHYPKTSVRGHKELTSTDCPGTYFPLDEIKKEYNNSNHLEVSHRDKVRAFQKFYNNFTQTDIPLDIDGLIGPKTNKAYEILGDILEV